MPYMLKRLSILLASASLISGLSFQAAAQRTLGDQITDVNTVTTAVPFLRIVPDARSGGMGDVGLAITPDMNCIYKNASQLAFVPGDYGAAITYTPWLRSLVSDINMVGLNGYYKIKKKQAIGLGLRYFSLGQITFTDNNAQVIRDFRPYELALDGHFSRALGKYFGAGISLRFIYSNLASGITPQGGETIKPGIAGAGDISFFFTHPIKLGKTIKSDINMGLVFSNLGSKISYNNSAIKDFIPSNLGIGLGWHIDINDHNEIALYYDMNKLMVPTPSTIDSNHNGAYDFRETPAVKGIFTSFNDAPGKYDASGNRIKGSRSAEEFREITHGVGLEYSYSKRFMARLGYFYESKYKGGRQFLTVGVGVKYSIFGLDFSYLVPTTSQRNPLDNTLRFTLLFDFNKSATNDPIMKRMGNKSGAELKPTN